MIISLITKKYCLFLTKCDFELFCNNDFSLRIETDFYHNTMKIKLRRYFIISDGRLYRKGVCIFSY